MAGDDPRRCHGRCRSHRGGASPPAAGDACRRGDRAKCAPSSSDHYQRGTSTTPGVELPGLDPDLMVRRRSRPNIFKHRPGAVHEPGERRRHTLPIGPVVRGAPPRAAVARTADATADKAYRQRFGNYAGLAEAELTTYRDLEDDAPDHANSNTARTAPLPRKRPSSCRSRTCRLPRPIVLCRAHRHGIGRRDRRCNRAIRARPSASSCGAKRRRSVFR